MNKEELTMALKYTEKKHRNDVVNTFDTDISMMCSDVLKVLKNCIEIQEGATNGEVIESLFPNVGANFSNIIDLNLWWKAKYKAESEDKE